VDRSLAGRVALRMGAGLAGALIAVAVGRLLFGFSLHAVPLGAPPDTTRLATDTARELRTRVSALERKLAARAPRGTYLVIDRANNRLWVRRGDRVLHEAVVSTGSRTVLKETGGQKRTWTFDTPSGRFEVRSERRNPVWVKPDWAFLEEGQQPPAGVRGRREEGSLGEWALDLGDGYMIHGTLYERLLGRSLTHGCIRVGRDDLRVVARAAVPGTRVYIF
jgi:lipoprotein-anchoring transpeptidase ErfK/SrfK